MLVHTSGDHFDGSDATVNIDEVSSNVTAIEANNDLRIIFT